MLSNTLTFTTTLLICALLRAQAMPPRVLTVCELLSQLDRYRGKEVHVRGELRTGTEEIALVEQCSKRFVADGHTWPNAIWLTPPGRLATEPVDFKLDEAAIRAMQAQINQARAAGKQGKVVVTFIGKCEARKHLGKDPRSTKVTGGFGHLGAYPAQLVYRSAEDVSINDR
jgi:hypothetical protein